MADPITATIMVASTVLTAVGQRNAGIAAQQEANYQAQIMERQAEIDRVNAISEQNMLNYQADQLEQKANQERALAQRNAAEKRRESVLAQSRAQAVAAAGGGGSFDPTVYNIMSDLEAEGDYNRLVALYEGNSAAVNYENQAALDRYEGDIIRQSADTQYEIDQYSADLVRTAGKNEKRAGTTAAFSTVLQGGGNIYDKYG